MVERSRRNFRPLEQVISVYLILPLLSVKILKSFGAFRSFPIFNNFVSQKLVVEQNGPKFGLVHVVSTYCVKGTFEC